MSVSLPNANQPSNSFSPRNKRFATKPKTEVPEQFDERDLEIEKLNEDVQSLKDILGKVRV